ncbi:hypothetical protein [Alteromonas sp. A079]|uniref:hypothetical protein n=1 Tax=Alteromonas sp. A079 TaxID=3410268 RepID=UPI003B9FC59F
MKNPVTLTPVQLADDAFNDVSGAAHIPTPERSLPTKDTGPITVVTPPVYITMAIGEGGGDLPVYL